MTRSGLDLQMQAFQRCVVERDAAAAEAVLDNDYLVHEWRVEEQLLADDGEGCAALLQRVQVRASVLGKDRSGPFVISDLWRLRNGTWKIWRRHSTPLLAGPMPGRAGQ